MTVALATPDHPYLQLWNTETDEVETYVGRGAGIRDRIGLLTVVYIGMVDNNLRVQEALDNDQDTATIHDLSMFIEVLNNQAASN